MQFSNAVVLALVAVANAAVPKKNMGTSPSNATWTTTTVTGYVTYCPESTTFTGPAKKTYTATASQWVTVTDCPKQCTISWQPNATPTVAPIPKNNGTAPVACATASYCPPVVPVGNGSYVAPTVPAPVATQGPATSSSGNTNAPAAGSSSSSTTGSNAGSNSPAEFTGAASTVAGSSAALVAVLGAVAYLL